MLPCPSFPAPIAGKIQSHNLDRPLVCLYELWLLGKFQLNPKLNPTIIYTLLRHTSTELLSYNSSIHSPIFTIMINNTSLSTVESNSSMPRYPSKMRNRDHQRLLIKQSSVGVLCNLQGEKDTVTHFYLASPSTGPGT